MSEEFRIGEAQGWLADHEVLTDAVRSVEWVGEGWIARWVIARHGDQLVVRALHLEADGTSTPAGGVTSDLLRDLSPSRAIAAASGNVPRIEELMIEWTEHLQAAHGPTAPAGGRRPPGRPRIQDDELVEIAFAYLQEQNRGPGVNQRLQTRFQMSESTVRDRISMCRQRGFLTATKQGRRGAQVGPELRRWVTGSAELDPKENR